MKSKIMLKQLILILLVFVVSAAFSYSQECGDVNKDGNVTIADALLIAQKYIGSDPPALTASLEIADVNCDGKITIIDALMVSQKYVGIRSELECCSPNATPAFIMGDVNEDGAFDIVDCLFIAQYLEGLIGPGDINLAAADINDDGVVTEADYFLLCGTIITE